MARSATGAALIDGVPEALPTSARASTLDPAHFDLTADGLDQARAFLEQVLDWRFERFGMPCEHCRVVVTLATYYESPCGKVSAERSELLSPHVQVIGQAEAGKKRLRFMGDAAT